MSRLNHDESRFNPASITFQLRFNHVFADKSQISRHDQQIVEKTFGVKFFFVLTLSYLLKH